MNSPSITVLMPVYNAAPFLREAIDSILRQSHSDFELLIIDDGSSDDSVDIVLDHCDSRIRLVRNEKNMGISATLNRGIQLSNTELIARMDADDISYRDRLEKQFAYMNAHPDCALLSTWARVITADKRFVRLERYRSNFYYYNLTFECWMYHPTVMFRKQAIESVGMYSMSYSEDFDLFWKISTRFKIANLAEALVDYRLSPNSLNTVLRKKEYEIANEQNVRRNIRYYVPDADLTNEQLECLRHNFDPIVNSGNTDAVIDAIGFLELFTDRFLSFNNPNRDERSIRDAHFFKRQFILNEVAMRLPPARAFDLLVRARAWQPLVGRVRHGVKWRVKELLRTVSF